MMKTYLKKLNGLLVTISLLTMVFSPVAMGQQAADNAEKVSQAQLQQFVTELGLNKSMTFGEFYKKNKDLFPPRVQKMVQPLVSKFKDEPMPQFEVATTQNSKGEKIATLRISGKDQMSNIQFLNEPGKFVKFDNTNLTEEDIVNFDDMFAKLYFTDASHRKGMGDAVTSPKNAKAQPPKFSGYPKITQQMWKKMTPLERARFMVNLRMLYSSAQEVIDLKTEKKQKGKKTSALEKWNLFFEMLDEANAADRKCVVAGYIGTYGANKRCQYPTGAVESSGCSMPCNPTIYGYGSGGKAFCLSDRNELQTATHYNKGCDKNMPLTSVEMSLPAKAAAKDSSRYQDVVEANKAQALADPSSLELTKKYLESMLQGSPEMKEAFQKGNLTPELLAKLQEIQTNFNSTIAAARNDCATASTEEQYDKNFWGACDQLHKRFLFVGAYLDKSPGCFIGETAVDPETLTCQCPNGPAIPPGQECPKSSGSSPGASPGEGGDAGGGEWSCDPECGKGEVCGPGSSDENGVKVGECKAAGADGKDKDKKPGFWSKLWGGIKKAAPWVLGGVGLWLIWKKVFDVKKPKLKSAGDRCPNGSVAPCAQSCTPPKGYVNGACACPSCPPGQTMTNAQSCLCENTSTTTTIFVCADGLTQVTDLANCPQSTTFTCWDNSQVSNPINCPVQPTPTKPTGTAN